MSSSKRYGLKLTLGGAPSALHTVIGIGQFHPDVPRPVGEDGDVVELDEARKLDKSKGTDLELVEIPQSHVSKLEDYWQQVNAGENPPPPNTGGKH